MISFDRICYNQIVKHAYAGDNEEVCGLLGGHFDAENSVVKHIETAENVADVPTIRYRIDPEEQLKQTEAIEEAGYDVVGFFHSHPAGPSNPSQTDAERATWPDRSYVIVSLDGYPFVGSWRWRSHNTSFEQETVVIRTPHLEE